MSHKLKIGFVSVEDAGDERTWSGTPYHLLNALRKQDVSIEVFSPLSQGFRYVLAPFTIAARLVKREVWVDRFPFALHSYARQLKQRMRRNPVDVILSTGTPAITLLDCAEPIVTYTDSIFHMMPGYYGRIWDQLTPGAIKLGKWQEETALERCTIGVYSSNWAADGARKCTHPDKIRVVPFGANMPVDHDQGTVQRWTSEKMNRLPRECQLLFIGVDWVRKGGAIAVETARLLNEMGVQTKLTIVGCQPNEEVSAYVEVLGFVNKQSSEGRKQLKELYRRATFFILPTRAEASAIVFCEASAYGVPTITFKTGGVEDYVRERINGVCLPLGSEPAMFARSIKEMIEDKAHYSALCVNAFKEYKSRLNWDTAAGALVKLCREALRGH